MTQPLDINTLIANLKLPGAGLSLPKAASEVKYAGPLALKSSQETNPAYSAFMNSLGVLYGLKGIASANLKWGDVQGLDRQTIGSSFVTPPRFMANPGFDHPKLAISLIPKADGKNVDHDTYHAPILLRDVDRWQFAQNTLGNYQINRWSGKEPGEEMFEQSRSFREIAELHTEGWGLKDSTPIVECIALVPIAPNGEFTLEFKPQIRFDTGDHTSYNVSVVKEDSLSFFTSVHQGSGTVIDVSDIDHSQKMFNFTANFVPDLSEIEQLLTPTSRGHFIIIANPTEPPRPKFDLRSEFGLGSGFDSYRGGGESRTMGGFSPTRGGASLGDISIGRGSQSGQGSSFTGELTNSRKGTATIFHVKLIGVKPDVAKAFDLSTFGALNGAIGAYQQN